MAFKWSYSEEKQQQKKILLTKMRKTKNSAHAAFSLKGGYPQGIITCPAAFLEEEETGQEKRRRCARS